MITENSSHALESSSQAQCRHSNMRHGPISPVATQRMHRELADLQRAESDLLVVQCVAESIDELHVTVNGPPDTPYQHGRFQLHVSIPSEYPFRAPLVAFDTPVWHPNICSSRGRVCLDLLNDKWAPGMCLSAVFHSIIQLLAQPVPDDPQDPVVAHQYRNSGDLFRRTAALWTSLYAQPAEADTTNEGEHELRCKLAFLMADGYGLDDSLGMLSRCSWDVQMAKERMLIKNAPRSTILVT